MRAGSGVAGTPGVLTPRVLPPELHACGYEAWIDTSYGQHVRTTTTTSTTWARHFVQGWSSALMVDLALFALATMQAAHWQCPPPERAEAAFDAQVRTAVHPHGPGHVYAPQPTAPEDGQGRRRGARCTTRRSSGRTHLPRSPARGTFPLTSTTACRGASPCGGCCIVG